MRKSSVTNHHDGAVVDCLEADMDLWWVDVCTRKPVAFAPRRLSLSRTLVRAAGARPGPRKSRV